jgi:hypothetical protein
MKVVIDHSWFQPSRSVTSRDLVHATSALDISLTDANIFACDFKAVVLAHSDATTSGRQYHVPYPFLSQEGTCQVAGQKCSEGLSTTPILPSLLIGRTCRRSGNICFAIFPEMTFFSIRLTISATVSGFSRSVFILTRLACRDMQ